MKLADWLQLSFALAAAGAAIVLAAHYQVDVRPRDDLRPLFNVVAAATAAVAHFVSAPFR